MEETQGQSSLCASPLSKQEQLCPPAMFQETLPPSAYGATANPPCRRKPTCSAAEKLGKTWSSLPILYMDVPPLMRALKAMFYILIKLKEKELDNSLKDLQATSISQDDSCSHLCSSSGPAHALMCGTNRFVTVISNMSLFRLHTYHGSSQAFHQSC